MQLTDAQMTTFEREGFLLIPEVFSPPETAVLQEALLEVCDPQHPSVVLDEGGAVRMVHGVHREHAAFRALAHHPRLIGPSRQLLGSPVYLFQSRLNVKPAFGRSAASGYPWHQDYSTWHFRDGMKQPQALVTFTFLDEITACNAPLMVIPGSHRAGVLGLENGQRGASGYFETPATWISKLAEEGGIEAAMAPAGTVALMHCNLVHGSVENISPLRRALCSIVFNAVDNRPQATDQPERYVSRDHAPVEPLEDDCLLRLGTRDTAFA